jgi:single-strand DNA-binding protein
MAGDTVITVIGNLTADPELRFTANGATPVANFTVASTPRTYDRASGEWKDGEALFLRCSIWREAAENVAESLTKGMRVIVQGRLVQRSYETREGERRTVVELQVDEVGPSLRYASAKVSRNPRSGGGGFDSGGSSGGGYGAPAGGYGGGGDGYGSPAQGGGGYGGPPAQGGGYGPPATGPSEDRWAAPGVAGSADDEPPF